MRFFLDLGLNGARRARDVRRWRNRVVSVSDCVNYNGFGYRRDAFHPLHRYLFDCEARGLVAARRAFVEFLRFYRPCDAAQALGLAPLDKEYPLFLMPWYRFTPASFRPLLTWRALPLDCSDLLTRYSARGLASYLIEQEWFWAERALDTLRNHGYDTRRGILQARAFVKADGERRYLLTDGNHRAAAMTFLGWDEVEICCDTLLEVRECDADKWWGVRHGFYSREAALALFHAYINGNARPHVAAQPAPIEASPDWKKLYLPQETNGACANGACANGACANGACANGACANGACANGACANGACANGACANGACANGACANETQVAGLFS